MELRPPAKLAAFGAILALVFAGAFAAGSVLGPPPSPAAEPAGGHGAIAGGGGHGEAAPAGVDAPGGLASSVGGYTLVPATTTLTPGRPEEFAFRVTGPDGAAATAFEVEHDQRMHLIVVRRDTSGFQHLHPRMGPDGTWRVPLSVAAGGAYRAFADFTPAGGPATTLGVDLLAPGRFDPVDHRPSRSARVDGYQVDLAGDLVGGRGSTLTLTVRRDGRPVTDLQPYLAAYGHLVALREGDLAYLHVHPEGAPGDGRTPAGPGIVFTAQVPSAGIYRLFLDFRHNGRVHTAAFTVATGDRP
jgi:hypothetical protein